MILRLLLVAIACMLASASPNGAGDPLREAVALLEAGQTEAALPLLDAAAERNGDPGLVAFNRGVALARMGRHREAEVQFARSLDDAAIPADRREKALYNRGVCLMERSGELDALRTAIDCFAACRESTSDPLLHADARHNLEVAKIRWLRLRAKEKNPPAPDDAVSESRPGEASDPTSDEEPGTSGAHSASTVKPMPGPGGVTGRKARPTTQSAPGTGTLPVLRDDASLKPLTAEDAQILLNDAAQRLARQRQAVESLRSGPDRPGVRDW